MHLRLASTRLTIKERLTKLSRDTGGIETERIDSAIQVGEEYADRTMHSAGPDSEPQNNAPSGMVFLGDGNRSCNTFRVLGEGCDVFEAANAHSTAVAHVGGGDLVILFQETGAFRQIVTSGGTFGYLPRTTKLEKTDHLAPDVFQSDGHAPEPLPAPKKAATQLSMRQMAMVTAFGAVVFVAVLLLQTLVR
jgi:hypothetical protein